MSTNSSPTNLKSISAAQDGSVYAIDNQGDVYEAIPGLIPWGLEDASLTLTSISAASDGTVLGVSAGSCYQFNAGTGTFQAFTALPNSAQMNQVSAASSSVAWAVDTEGNAYQYSPSANSWSSVLGPTSGGSTVDLGSIQAALDAVWAVDYSGNLWSYDASAWSPIATPKDLPMASISMSVGGWVWGIDSQNYGVWQYAGSGLPWVPRPPLSSATPLCVSTGDDTTTWGLDSNGAVFSYDPATESWTPISSLGTESGNPSFSQLAVADALDIWGIGTSGVYTYSENAMNWVEAFTASTYLQIAAQNSGAAWFLLSDNTVAQGDISDSVGIQNLGGGLLQISGGSDGTLWGVGMDNNPWQYSDSSWGGAPYIVPGAAGDIIATAVGSQSLVYALDKSGNVYQYSEQSSNWSTLSSAGSTKATLVGLSAAADGSLFAIDESDYVYTYLGSWFQMGGSLAQVTAGSATMVWGIDVNGNPVQLTLGSAPTSASASPAKTLRYEGSIVPAWDAENPFDELSNTHLWIVDHGFALARQEPSIGSLLLSIFRNDVFHTNLCQGLYDADFESPYNDPFVVPTYKSHFYNPENGLNYLGESSPTALTRGREYFHAAVNAYPTDMATAGYQLGLSLHYLTDLTQPMHSSNFTALSSLPVIGSNGYHASFESYVLERQSSVAQPPSYLESQLGLSPDAYLIRAAETSRRYFPTISPLSVYLDWHGELSDSLKGAIDSVLVPMMSDAIVITAQYLVAWGRNLSQSR